MRTGYTFAPGDWTWRLGDETDLPGAPDVGLKGFYIRVMIGGWGRTATES